MYLAGHFNVLTEFRPTSPYSCPMYNTAFLEDDHIAAAMFKLRKSSFVWLENVIYYNDISSILDKPARPLFIRFDLIIKHW